MLISICIGSACHLKGSYTIISNFQELIEENNLEDQIELKASFCLEHCQNGVSVQIDEEPTIFSVTPETTKQFFAETILKKLNMNT